MFKTTQLVEYSFQLRFWISLTFCCYLGGARPACADVTGPKDLLVAQNATAGVLLVVQELLKGAESMLDVRGARNFLQKPADLVWVVFHLEQENEDEDTEEQVGHR